MSEDARKDCRTQGKYSERNQYYEDKRTQKRQDKRQKGSPTAKEVQEKKSYNRRSDGGRSSTSSLVGESESSIRYEENSVHTFSQLKDVKKPVEIKTPGKHILSNTENGESVVHYEPYFLEENEAFELLQVLRDTTSWNEKNIVIHGAEYKQPRLIAWYGPFPYSYSGTTLEPKEMPATVLEIKKKVEDYLSEKGMNVTLNSVLLNLYRDSKDSVAWHSDDELSMGVSPTIASVSLGATRKFEMRYKHMQSKDGHSVPKDEECFIHLTNGSLLIMDGCMQQDWQHRVPKDYHDREARINLTFRTVYKLEDVPPRLGDYPSNHSCSQVVKRSSGSKTDFGVNYDDEDFPPLSSSSPVYSNGRKSRESGGSMEVKSSEWNGSHRRSNGTSRNKALLKNNNETSESSDMDTERFSRNKTCLKTNKIHSSDKISASEVSHNKFSSKACDKGVSGSDYYVEPFDNGSSRNKALLKNNNETSESSDMDTDRFSRNKTCLKTNKIRSSDKISAGEVSHNKFSSKACDKGVSGSDYYVEPFDNGTSRNKALLKNNETSESSEMDTERFSRNKTCLKTNKIHSSDKISASEVSHNKFSSKACDKGVSGSDYYVEPFDNKNALKADESEIYWDAESPPCDNRDDGIINRSENQVIEQFSNEQSTILNNLNEDKNNVKIDMENKNLHAYDSDFSSSNTNVARKNKNFQVRDSYNGSANSMQENVHAYKVNETPSNKNRIWTPNVEAKEFVPTSRSNSTVSEFTPYDTFDLENLLNYTIELMDGDTLRSYAFALRNKVLEKMLEFNRFQDELEVLCELTDGDQTEKNQKIISTRMCSLVKKSFRHATSPNFGKSYAVNHRRYNHGNQNNFPGRKYHSSSGDRSYRQ